jgi:hypothetical protein
MTASPLKSAMRNDTRCVERLRQLLSHNIGRCHRRRVLNRLQQIGEIQPRHPTRLHHQTLGSQLDSNLAPARRQLDGADHRLVEITNAGRESHTRTAAFRIVSH